MLFILVPFPFVTMEDGLMYNFLFGVERKMSLTPIFIFHLQAWTDLQLQLIESMAAPLLPLCCHDSHNRQLQRALESKTDGMICSLGRRLEFWELLAYFSSWDKVRSHARLEETANLMKSMMSY